MKSIWVWKPFCSWFMVRAFVCENQKGGSRLEVRVHGSRFMVHGSRFVVRGRSFDVVSELAFRLQVHECRGDARRQDTRCRRNPREVPFSFISFSLGFFGVCVCVCEASSDRVELV